MYQNTSNNEKKMCIPEHSNMYIPQITTKKYIPCLEVLAGISSRKTEAIPLSFVELQLHATKLKPKTYGENVSLPHR